MINENSELLPVPNAYDYVNKRKGLTRKERRRLAKELGVEFTPRYNGEVYKNVWLYEISGIHARVNGGSK